MIKIRNKKLPPVSSPFGCPFLVLENVTPVKEERVRNRVKTPFLTAHGGGPVVPVADGARRRWGRDRVVVLLDGVDGRHQLAGPRGQRCVDAGEEVLRGGQACGPPGAGGRGVDVDGCDLGRHFDGWLCGCVWVWLMSDFGMGQRLVCEK